MTADAATAFERTNRSMADEPTGTSFLRSIAARVGVQVAVIVMAGRPARFTPIAATPTISGLGDLEAVGRHWLALHQAGTVDPAALVVELPDPSIAMAPVREGDALVGVLLVAKGAGRRWTSGERALLGVAVDFHRVDIAAWGRQPAPIRVGDSPTASPTVPTAHRSTPFEDELQMRYQPEVDLATGRIVAFEALARWAHPDRGLLGPVDFIDLAERTGLIGLLGGWILDRSVRDYAPWARADTTGTLMLRVNLSPGQIEDPTIVDRVADLLRSEGLLGQRLCLEVTETMMVTDLSATREMLARLRNLGLQIALDDLGIGYSSLARLRELTVDAAKIDRSLVRDIDADGRAQAIVGALVRLADDLSLDLVAEGVEDEAQAQCLRSLGVRRAQGHLFGRPVVAADVPRMLAEQPGPSRLTS